MSPWFALLIAGVVLVAAVPAVAQSGGEAGSGLGDRLRGASVEDLAGAIEEASREMRTMTPEQRAAASMQAQTLVPALMGEVAGWWAGLTPQQQSAYGQQLQRLNDAQLPSEVQRLMPR